MVEKKNPILKLEKVCKAFGGVVAADDVSFAVEPGEIMGLIGPNGAGKTTTLNLISGIYEVDGGKIMLGDTDMTKLPSHTRARMGLGRTFQAPRFLHRSSIRDNMLLGTDLSEQKGYFCSFFTKDSVAFEGQLDKLMQIAGFTLPWDEPITSLPYGRRKLLEIVRALLSKPQTMLVDEPAAGLNSKEIERVVALLHYAADELGVGVVLIEHSMDLIMSICHDIVVLNFGKVIAEGTPYEVSHNQDVIEAYLGRDYNAENS